MNLTERAEIRKETFYKLTNSRDVPEAPSEGGRNLFKGSRDFSGSWVNGGSGVYAEDHQGVKIFKKNSMWGGLSQYFEVKTGEEYVFSSYVKSSAKTDRVTFYLVHSSKQPQAGGVVSFDSADGRDAVSFDLTDKYKRIAIKIKITKDGWIMPRLERYDTDAYLFFGGYKFEKGSESTPYSQAPEDFGWSKDTLVPTQSNRYLWKFEYIYYSDGSVENTQPVNISIAGADGTNGQTSHVHFAFADNATGGGFSLTTPKAYMGWYADFNEAASTDPTKYRWSKWKGDQGLPGKPGADGKTSYFHMAYADSADGRTGFSFKESGQQYQGYYTDFVQANSTDPTKYAWMDRRAGVEVSGRNLWIQSKATGGFVEETLPDNHITGQKKCYRIPNNKELSFNIEPDFSSRLYRKVTFSAWVKYENVVQGTNNWNVFNCFKHTLYLKNSSTGATSTANYLTLEGFVGTSDWKYITYTYDYAAIKSYDQLKSTIRFNLEWAKSGTAWVTGVMVQFGNVATGHVWAPEDIQADIDSKADQTLTQEQLNALAEKNNLIKAEMEAKASIDAVDKWITAYENYVKANDADKAKSEQALKEASERILGMRYEVNDLKFAWDAIDRFMSFQNEGLIIGKKDGSAYAKFSDDRISLFSGSSEVMYISQGTLNIANGIFTKTIQIGRFRFETHPADADMLVLRYLGG